jgi:hypothetical protein
MVKESPTRLWAARHALLKKTMDFLTTEYPGDWTSDELHLLFDTGYSAAMLYRCRVALAPLAEVDENVAHLVKLLDEFQEKRFNRVGEIYKAADKLHRAKLL